MQRDRDLAIAAACFLACACGGAGKTPDGGGADTGADATATDGIAGDGTPADAPPRFLPGPATVLSTGNAVGQDEDPAILRARDDTLYAVWYSNRNGLQPDGNEDKEIFLSRSTDGATWSTPLQVTRNAAWAFFPSMTQDGRGAFHLAWWRVTLLPAGCKAGVDCTGTDNKIVYKSSPDGVTWDLDQETTIATGPGDWLPSIVHDRTRDRLLVFFAAVARNAAGGVDLNQRTTRLHVVIRDGSTWSAPARLAVVNPDTSHNSYPHVLQGGDGTFRMAWTRYDASAPSDVLQVLSEPSTETMVATSTDGTTWSAPVAMTSGTGIDVLPSLHVDHAGTWWATWLTTVFGGAVAVELRFGGNYATDLVRRPEITGYSPRILATAAPGVFWAAWVGGASPTQKIEHRFFTK